MTSRSPHRRGVRAVVLGLVALLVAAAPAAPPAARPAPGLRPPPQLAVASVPDGWPQAPAATAAAFLLLDADTGQVLAERNADDPRAVASTIKVLTALTVLNRTEPDDPIVIPARAAGVGGASVGLRTGSIWTVEQLLDGLIARSGNDAATALAIAVGGSVDGFVALMRADAAALGVTDLTLVSPSGLDDDNRLSARALATISRAAMADPRFREVAGRETVTLPGRGVEETRNELLGSYPGATGIKTGFTEAAGYSLVASATRGGRDLIAVVLGSRSPSARFTDAAALLDHGFEAFEVVSATYDAQLRIAGGWVDLHADGLDVTVPTSDPGVTTVLQLPIEAPDEADERPVEVLWQGEELGTLVVETAAEPRPDVSGGGAVGRFLVDRAYAAMRAATTTAAWPPDGSSTR